MTSITGSVSGGSGEGKGRIMRSADTLWYLMLPLMEKFHIDVSREWFKSLIKKICDSRGVKRSDIGITTGARAELYFNGGWDSVSFDVIDDLARKGTDIVFIEKQGIIDELVEHADKYGVALVNSRGYLTEYAHDLISAAQRSGGNVIIITDYDLSGVNLASKCPAETHYITMDDTTLEYFDLDRDDPEIAVRATNTKLIDHVKDIVETDPRFANIDIEFLSSRRIEINAVLAKVGHERFWKFIMDKLTELFPTRNYNRAINLPSQDNEADETDLYPNAIKKLILHVREITSDVAEETEKQIYDEQSEVEGFLDILEQKQNNKDRVIKIISEDEEILKIESEITELCKSLDIDLESDDEESDGGGSHSRPRKKSR
jgi:hypothetical protein